MWKRHSCLVYLMLPINNFTGCFGRFHKTRISGNVKFKGACNWSMMMTRKLAEESPPDIDSTSREFYIGTPTWHSCPCTKFQRSCEFSHPFPSKKLGLFLFLHYWFTLGLNPIVAVQNPVKPPAQNPDQNGPLQSYREQWPVFYETDPDFKELCAAQGRENWDYFMYQGLLWKHGLDCVCRRAWIRWLLAKNAWE